MVKKPLGETMVELGIITEEQLREALVYQEQHKCRFGQAIVSLKYAGKRDIFYALAHQYNYPYINVIEERIFPEVAAMVSAEIAKKYEIVPVAFEDGKLYLAISPPFELSLLEKLENEIGRHIEFVLTPPDQLKEVLRELYP